MASEGFPREVVSLRDEEELGEVWVLGRKKASRGKSIYEVLKLGGGGGIDC